MSKFVKVCYPDKSEKGFRLVESKKTHKVYESHKDKWELKVDSKGNITSPENLARVGCELKEIDVEEYVILNDGFVGLDYAKKEKGKKKVSKKKKTKKKTVKKLTKKAPRKKKKKVSKK